MSSHHAKPRATALPRLDWQGELDSAMADLDTRLTDPRRFATDANRQPATERGHVHLTAEMLDEIARRVAEQIQQPGGAPPLHVRSLIASTASPPSTASPAPTHAPAPSAEELAPAEAPATCAETPLPLDPETGRTALRPGKRLRVRYKMPAMPWPFSLLQRRRRKKQHPLTTARLRA